MISIREARELDVDGIREIFLATYGSHYAHPEIYDLQVLKKKVFDDDTLVLVAEDPETRRILGTASILFDITAFGDLVGEFGRLAVHPDGRNRGIGHALMDARLERSEGRLHLGLAENRVEHPFSQAISARHGFIAAGFLPQRLFFRERESIALYVRHFGDALRLRRNHPKVIPESCLLAQLVLSGCGLEPDAVVDSDTPSYPNHPGFEFEELTTQGYASLLRFERARAAHREIFGPSRLIQGLFQMEASHAHYLVAREKGQLAGAIGFTVDELEKAVTIFELVTVDSRPKRPLVEEAVRYCEDNTDIAYAEVNISAYCPGMQRTFLEMQFLPVAYVPALAFEGAERCDAIRMARLFVPFDVSNVELAEPSRAVADTVIRSFRTRQIQPQLVEALSKVSSFSGLDAEQSRLLASLCSTKKFDPGEKLFELGQESRTAFLLLRGEVSITADSGREVGTVGAGECLAESGLLTAHTHAVTATARTPTEVAVMQWDDLDRLIRQRTDVGLVLYRNLARGLGEKLRRTDAQIARDQGS